MNDPGLSALDNEDRVYLEQFPRERYKVYEVAGIGRFYVDNIDDGIKNWLRKGIAWEQHLVILFQRHVRPGTVVIDAGAHVGTHTVSLSRFVGPSGRHRQSVKSGVISRG